MYVKTQGFCQKKSFPCSVSISSLRKSFETSKYVVVLFVAPAEIRDIPPRYLDGLKFCKGDTVHARIMFVGRPTPTATWTLADKTLKSQKRVEIKTTTRHSILMINDAERTDDGVYRLTVENKLGSDYVDIPITVIGT